MNLPEMNEQNAQAGTVLNTYQVAYDRAAIEQYLARSGEPMEPYVHNGVLTVPPGMYLGVYARLTRHVPLRSRGAHGVRDGGLLLPG